MTVDESPKSHPHTRCMSCSLVKTSSRVGHEVRQQVELAGGQHDRPAVDRHGVGRRGRPGHRSPEQPRQQRDRRRAARPVGAGPRCARPPRVGCTACPCSRRPRARGRASGRPPSPRALRTMTAAWSSSARRRRSTSRPDIIGSMTSSTTTSGRRSRHSCRALTPSLGDERLEARPAQVGREHARDRRVVLHDQDRCRHARSLCRAGPDGGGLARSAARRKVLVIARPTRLRRPALASKDEGHSGGDVARTWAEVDLVLPCLDEDDALPWVLDRMPPGRAPSWSTTARATAHRAGAAHGALVVEAPQRGYGAACHAGCSRRPRPSSRPGRRRHASTRGAWPTFSRPQGRRPPRRGPRRPTTPRGLALWLQVANHVLAQQASHGGPASAHDIGPMRLAPTADLRALGISTGARATRSRP